MANKRIQTPILAIRKLHFEKGDMLILFTDVHGYSEQSMQNIKDVLDTAIPEWDVPVLVLHGDADAQVQKGNEGKIPVFLTNLEYLTLMRQRKGIK